MVSVSEKEGYLKRFESQGINCVKDNIRYGRYGQKKLLLAEDWIRSKGEIIKEEPRIINQTTNNIIIVGGPKWVRRVLSWLPWTNKSTVLLEGKTIEDSNFSQRRDQS